MRTRRTRPLVYGLCLALAGLALALLPAAPSQARMGGGHAYSGGGSSGGSRGSAAPRGGGGGSPWSAMPSSGYSGHAYGGSPAAVSGGSADGGDKTALLVELVLLALVVYILVRLLSQRPAYYAGGRAFQSGAALEPAAADSNLDERLLDLQARDGNFSKVLFLDFASLLYHKFYSYRGTEPFKLLAPYLSKSIAEQTAGNVFYPRQRVHSIVVGKAAIANILPRDGGDSIVVEFESNLTVRYPTGEQARFANQEQWTFARQKGLLSPPPAQMRALSCPACGAPADFTDAGECQYCKSVIQAGEKQWQVLKMSVIGSQPYTPADPAGYAQEAGTELPTLKQADLKTHAQTFAKNHGLADWEAFFKGFRESVVQPYFLATYAAWSQGDWRRARHLVSDRLYESNNFWMGEYARQGWQNRLENIQIQDVAAARVDLDKFYESITVRVFAACLDYTVDKQGKLLGGSLKKARKFSEYWTFIRVSGVEKIAAAYDLKTCPACGAPADKVGQAGDCGYCGSKLTEGQFSWVLAAIAQDEAYSG